METIIEQKEWVKNLRERIPEFEQKHQETLRREEEQFKEKMKELSSYYNQFMMVIKEILGKAEKKLTEMLTKFCESCGGEVKLRSCTGSSLHSDSLYICKACGHIQSVYIE